MQKMNCETCQSGLFDFHEGTLDPAESARVDAHLQDCDACAALLADIWQMNLVSSRWQDQQVGPWNRSEHLAQRSGWQFPQVLATAASLLALVIVLTDTHVVSTDEGLTFKVGRDDYVTQQSLARLRSDQAAIIDERFQKLTSQQAASNQVLLRSVLETSREERREDFTTLLTYWNTAQAKQQRETQEELRYLMASQAEDQKDIQQLSNAFQTITLQRGSDM